MPLVVLPLFAGLVSTVLFFTQGGFGGGHGNFDGLIVILGLPSIYLVQMVFLPEWVLYVDFSYSVILPTMMNTVLAWIAYRVVRRFVSPRPRTWSNANQKN